VGPRVGPVSCKMSIKAGPALGSITKLVLTFKLHSVNHLLTRYCSSRGRIRQHRMYKLNRNSHTHTLTQRVTHTLTHKHTYTTQHNIFIDLDLLQD